MTFKIIYSSNLQRLKSKWNQDFLHPPLSLEHIIVCNNHAIIYMSSMK